MKLAYREFGKGQPLIILHGLFGQSDNWNTLARNFSEHNLHVFTIDQRNHGLSPHADTWNYTVMAEDLREFILEHQLAEPILLGHSMGGKTVLFYEAIFPNTAKKIIIADMAARAYEPHHDQVLAALNAVDFDFVTSRKEVETILNQYLNDFGTKQFLLKNIYWKDASTTKMDWRFNLKTITESYNNIGIAAPEFKSNTPTRIIRGERSEYVSDLDMEDFRKRFSEVDLVTIAQAGHWVHAEKPKEFFEAVINFTTV
jgi:esterase